jgi:hypothetical protein
LSHHPAFLGAATCERDGESELGIDTIFGFDLEFRLRFSAGGAGAFALADSIVTAAAISDGGNDAAATERAVEAALLVPALAVATTGDAAADARGLERSPEPRCDPPLLPPPPPVALATTGLFWVDDDCMRGFEIDDEMRGADAWCTPALAEDRATVVGASDSSDAFIANVNAEPLSMLPLPLPLLWIEAELMADIGAEASLEATARPQCGDGRDTDDAGVGADADADAPSAG